MNTGDAVRKVMELEKVGVNQLADKIGKSPRLVSERLSQENISISKLQEMLRVLDYEIVIVPRNTKLSANSFKIE